jgi:hypothetical protein
MALQTRELVPHPASPPRGVQEFSVTPSFHGGWLRLRYRLRHSWPIVVPPFAGRKRADELWRTTCFEMFVRMGEGPGYAEFNFSPSENWAAYDFDAAREGMRERDVPHAPVCTIRRGSGLVIFDAEIPLSALPSLPAKAGLTAVLEQQGGLKSYWALAHGGDTPDFHDPACFAATLAPPESP